MTTTITRQQLRDAIEAGIAAAERHESFAPEHAVALRAAAEAAPTVARGTFMAPCAGGGWVPCPLALAFPDWAGEFAWDLTFTTAFDSATWQAISGHSSPTNVLQVTDEPDLMAALKASLDAVKAKDNEGSTEGAA